MLGCPPTVLVALLPLSPPLHSTCYYYCNFDDTRMIIIVLHETSISHAFLFHL